MENHSAGDARDRGPAIEIKRTGSTLTLCLSTDAGHRIMRRNLRRIGADVKNLGTYSLRAELDTEPTAKAIERMLQCAGARGVRDLSAATPETGMPHPPVKASA